MRKSLAAIAASLALALSVGSMTIATLSQAAEQTAPVVAGDIEISAAWARAMLPGQPAGGGYLTLTNKGAAADRLTGASSPTAGKVELHEMKIENDVMIMRPVEGGLEIAPGATVELKPGGFHLMFMKVTEPFAEGGTVPVTLEFEKAGKVEVALPVKTKGVDDHAGHGG